MYERIFKGRYIPDTVESIEEEIRIAVLEDHLIFFMGFDNGEDSIQFANKFPKYVKLKLAWASGVGSGEHYMIEFNIRRNVHVTGEVDETGLKRLDGLIKTMKKEGYIQ